MAQEQGLQRWRGNAQTADPGRRDRFQHRCEVGCVHVKLGNVPVGPDALHPGQGCQQASIGPRCGNG